MGMKDDLEGRAVMDCTTLLPDSATFPTKVVKIGGERVEELVEVVKEEKKEEAFVAALDVSLLHRRVGHLGTAGMESMAQVGLVAGLELRARPELRLEVGWVLAWQEG